MCSLVFIGGVRSTRAILLAFKRKTAGQARGEPSEGALKKTIEERKEKATLLKLAQRSDTW